MPSDDEYNKAVAIWKTKGFKIFEEYIMYYCECDVDLLMEGLDNYRKLFWKTSKLEILILFRCLKWHTKTYYRTILTTKSIPDEKTFNIINESLYGGNCPSV
jgi:hypothetical protein